MISLRLLRTSAVALSGVGLLAPQSLLAAQITSPAEVQAASPAVLDIALAEGGVMRGQVVDEQGQGVAEAPISVIYEGKQVAKTVSDAQGRFAVSGLRGGQHVVVSDDHAGLCRVWSAQTAPPSANDRVLIVKGNQTVRGQGLGGRAGLIMIGVLGGIVAGGLISQEHGRSGS